MNLTYEERVQAVKEEAETALLGRSGKKKAQSTLENLMEEYGLIAMKGKREKYTIYWTALKEDTTVGGVTLSIIYKNGNEVEEISKY